MIEADTDEDTHDLKIQDESLWMARRFQNLIVTRRTTSHFNTTSFPASLQPLIMFAYLCISLSLSLCVISLSTVCVLVVCSGLVWLVPSPRRSLAVGGIPWTTT